MTTKELLALVGKWRNGVTLAKWAPGLEVAADELAPIATALCAEVEAQKEQNRLGAARELAYLDRAEAAEAQVEALRELARAVVNAQYGEDEPNWKAIAHMAQAAIDAAKEPK